MKKLLMVLLLIVGTCAMPCSAYTYDTLIKTDFSDGTVSPWGIQANTGDISVVADPANSAKKVMKAHININEDFTNVVNKTPRAEILYTKQQLVNDSEYVIYFNTYLPQNFQIETTYSNPNSFFQIHQNIQTGSPQLALHIDKNNYVMNSNSSDAANPQYKSVTKTIGSINSDLGKWTEWMILYKPSYSTAGKVVIWKNGVIVLNYSGVCAYSGITGYPKFGIYKWNWQKTPTSTSDITTYFSDIQILQRK